MRGASSDRCGDRRCLAAHLRRASQSVRLVQDQDVAMDGGAGTMEGRQCQNLKAGVGALAASGARGWDSYLPSGGW
jgi:hypothetical protein